MTDTVDRALPRSARSMLSVGEVVCALVASRLCSPSPLYDVAGWASGAAVHELLGIPPALLNDDRLGRALETFAVYAEDLRSRVAAGAIERFGVGAGRLHVDLTTVGVAGAYEDSALVAKGWASDRRVARQVRTLQAATPDGTVLYSRPDPGNASELTLVGAALERLLALSGPGLLIVCDSAMGQPKTLREIDRRRRAVHRAVAREHRVPRTVPRRRRPRTRCARVRYLPEREASFPPRSAPASRARYATGRSPAATRDAPLALRVAYIHSSEEATQVAQARERALVKAEDALDRVRNGLGGRYYKTRGQVERRIGQILAANVTGLIDVNVTTRKDNLTLTWQRNHEAIATAASFDGIYALATNLPGRLTAGQILRLYKDQQIVERRHRDLKQTLKVRPIFLHNDDRVYALISIVGISPADLRPDRSPNPRRARPRPATTRTAPRRPRRQTHRPQHPRRIPRPRPHLHPHRHPTRPAHRHPTTHPRPTPNPAALADTARPCPHEPRKMGLAADATPQPARTHFATVTMRRGQ